MVNFQNQYRQSAATWLLIELLKRFLAIFLNGLACVPNQTAHTEFGYCIDWLEGVLVRQPFYCTNVVSQLSSQHKSFYWNWIVNWQAHQSGKQYQNRWTVIKHLIQHLTKSFIWRVKWIQIGFHWSIKLWIGKWWRAIKPARAGDLLHQARRMFCGLPQSTVQSLLLFPRAGALTAGSPQPHSPWMPGESTASTQSCRAHALLWAQAQLPAMTFWLCHHGFGSKLLTFRSSLNTTFSAFTLLPTSWGLETAAEGHYARTRDFQLSHGCLSDLGKVSFVPFDAI